MANPSPPTGDHRLSFGVDGLRALFDGLVASGHEVIGPTVTDGVIVNDVLASVDDLPVGWTDEQEGGRYRLADRGDRARFGHAVGPRSAKEVLHPPREQVWTLTRDEAGGLTVDLHETEPVARAFFGIKPCELAAMAKQDRVLAGGPHPDPAYSTRRADVFTVVVECGTPADTCFCPSMGTGPGVGAGYDVALTELVPAEGAAADGEPRYLARAGSPGGTAALAGVPTEPASTVEVEAAALVVDRARSSITRTLDAAGARDRLFGALEDPGWDSVAERCLSCGNCTAVCPTCFCTDLVDVTDLGGDTATRWRVWDTCYSTEFSHLGPGPVRASTASRYRQWLTHKLAGWHDQFDESGCVGCGRCITWCPVGIDLTVELEAICGGGR
jgi:ferredoxin